MNTMAERYGLGIGVEVTLEKEEGEFWTFLDEGRCPRTGNDAVGFEFKSSFGVASGRDGDFSVFEGVFCEGVVAGAGVVAAGAFCDFFFFINFPFIGVPFYELELLDLLRGDEIRNFFDDACNGVVFFSESFFEEVVAVFIRHFQEPGFLCGKNGEGADEAEEE